MTNITLTSYKFDIELLPDRSTDRQVELIDAMPGWESRQFIQGAFDTPSFVLVEIAAETIDMCGGVKNYLKKFAPKLERTRRKRKDAISKVEAEAFDGVYARQEAHERELQGRAHTGGRPWYDKCKD